MTASYEYKRSPTAARARSTGGWAVAAAAAVGDHSCNLHSKRRKSGHGTWVLQQIVERMRERTAATPLRPPKAMHHGLAQSRARLFGGGMSLEYASLRFPFSLSLSLHVARSLQSPFSLSPQTLNSISLFLWRHLSLSLSSSS